MPVQFPGRIERIRKWPSVLKELASSLRGLNRPRRKKCLGAELLLWVWCVTSLFKGVGIFIVFKQIFTVLSEALSGPEAKTLSNLSGS